jgi:hypothetical protein
MPSRNGSKVWQVIGLIYATAVVGGCSHPPDPSRAGRSTIATSVCPSSMHPVGTVDDRYQSYNVEMLEVTGGKFWKPYSGNDHKEQPSSSGAPAAPGGNTPAGMDPGAYAYRPPIDLANIRRRTLARALGPAYVRVSGTWANTTYFPDADADDAPASPPPGFDGVLRRQQWEGVIDFARAVDASIVTSFATGAGTRDARGVWTPDQARRLLVYTRDAGGGIAAAEFMNEPTFAAMGGAPKGYDAAAYGRDFKVFRAFAKQAAPDMLVLGPGSVGETTGDWGVAYGQMPMLHTRDLLAASNPAGVDAFSYHHYGAGSVRCAGAGMPGTTADAALSEEWLARTDQTLAFYRQLRDEFEPGKPLWLTETADAACGGNPWASTFLDTFRYLDQLGRLARHGVKVVVHNTLDASDYGLLDEDTLAPRPNYWGALLWRKLMGTVVLDSGIPLQKGLHVYAHSLRGTPGGVALLVINNDPAAPRTLHVQTAGERYTLWAAELRSRQVRLNGDELTLGKDDALPRLAGEPFREGKVTFAPGTITFLALPRAGNRACE